mmetsp:Transcript_29366/g.40552  ORF Transcript_29366/g.40552 Transcript_29366/m.40552 type:complete len:152 (+) Transcript_29366:21-476(+)
MFSLAQGPFSSPVEYDIDPQEMFLSYPENHPLGVEIFPPSCAFSLFDAPCGSPIESLDEMGEMADGSFVVEKTQQTFLDEEMKNPSQESSSSSSNNPPNDKENAPSMGKKGFLHFTIKEDCNPQLNALRKEIAHEIPSNFKVSRKLYLMNL